MPSFFVVKMWHLLPLAPNGCLAVRFSTILRQPFVAERCIYRILTTKWGGALMYVALCVGSSLTTLHRCAKGIRASSSCRLTFESYSGHKNWLTCKFRWGDVAKKLLFY